MSHQQGVRFLMSGESSHVNEDGDEGSRSVVAAGFTYSNDRAFTAISRAEIRHDSGTLDRNQFVSFNKLDYRLGTDFTLEARYRYSKTTDDKSNVTITLVNLDPYHTQSGWVSLPLQNLQIDPNQPVHAVLLIDTPMLYDPAAALPPVPSTLTTAPLIVKEVPNGRQAVGILRV